MKSSGSKITCVVPSRYGVFSVYRTCPLSVSASRAVAIAGVTGLQVAQEWKHPSE